MSSKPTSGSLTVLSLSTASSSSLIWAMKAILKTNSQLKRWASFSTVPIHGKMLTTSYFKLSSLMCLPTREKKIWTCPDPILASAWLLLPTVGTVTTRARDVKSPPLRSNSHICVLYLYSRPSFSHTFTLSCYKIIHRFNRDRLCHSKRAGFSGFQGGELFEVTNWNHSALPFLACNNKHRPSKAAQCPVIPNNSSCHFQMMVLLKRQVEWRKSVCNCWLDRNMTCRGLCYSLVCKFSALINYKECQSVLTLVKSICSFQPVLIPALRISVSRWGQEGSDLFSTDKSFCPIRIKGTNTWWPVCICPHDQRALGQVGMPQRDNK